MAQPARQAAPARGRAVEAVRLQQVLPVDRGSWRWPPCRTGPFSPAVRARSVGLHAPLILVTCFLSPTRPSAGSVSLVTEGAGFLVSRMWTCASPPLKGLS